VVILAGSEKPIHNSGKGRGINMLSGWGVQVPRGKQKHNMMQKVPVFK